MVAREMLLFEHAAAVRITMVNGMTSMRADPLEGHAMIYNQ
jgi:hypothetical protein